MERLPLVEFRVEDARRRENDGFTNYRISLKTNFAHYENCVIVVWRRFRQFLQLYDNLRKACPNIELPEFPKKKPVGRFDEEVIKSRKDMFQKFLNCISEHPALYESVYVRDFFDDDNSSDENDSIHAFAVGIMYEPIGLDPYITRFKNKNIVFLSLGTTDIHPLLTVAYRFQTLGFKIQVVASPMHEKFILAHRLPYKRLPATDSSSEELVIKLPSGDYDRTTTVQLDALIPWTEKVDLICYSQGLAETFAALCLGEKFNIPIYGIYSLPEHPTSSLAHYNVAEFHLPIPILSTNKESYNTFEKLNWNIVQNKYNLWRERVLGLEKLKKAQWISKVRAVPVSYVISPSILTKPTDWPAHVDVSGFVYLASQSPSAGASNAASISIIRDDNYSPVFHTSRSLAAKVEEIHPLAATPPEAIIKFINLGPKPVFLGFDLKRLADMTPEQRIEFLNLITDAVKDTKLRCFLCFVTSVSSPSYDSIQIPDSMTRGSNSFCLIRVSANIFPFQWLFSKCAAVIHDCSPQLLSAALSSGVPSFPVTFNRADEFIWTNLLSKLNIGPDHVSYSKLNGRGFFTSLSKVAVNEETQLKADALGERIRSENGIDRTLWCIFRWMSNEVPIGSISPSSSIADFNSVVDE